MYFHKQLIISYIITTNAIFKAKEVLVNDVKTLCQKTLLLVRYSYFFKADAICPSVS